MMRKIKGKRMRVTAKGEDFCSEMGVRAAGDGDAGAVRVQNESV